MEYSKAIIQQQRKQAKYFRVLLETSSVPLVLIWTLLCALIYGLWFGAFLRLPLSSDPAAWGQFGDFLAGLLNPVIAFMAFFWLLQSVRLQKTELAETRQELSKAAKAQETAAEANKEIAALNLKAMKLAAYGHRLAVLAIEAQTARADVEYFRHHASQGSYRDQFGDPCTKSLFLSLQASAGARLNSTETAYKAQLENMNELMGVN